MPNQTPLYRHWLLLRSLSARRYGLTIREMASEAEVGIKTIRRDLDMFRTNGFPLVDTTDACGRKTYRLTALDNVPLLSFRLDEALALYLGRRFLEPLAGTMFWEAAQSAFRKIRASLDERALAQVEKMSGFFHATRVGVSDYALKAKVLDALTQGIEDSLAVHLVYQSDQATEAASRDVYPYDFAYHHGSIYLLAHDPRAQKVKHYKIDRVEEAEVSQFPFRRDPDFDVKKHLLPCFGVFLTDGPLRTNKVRFAPAVARYVQESEWHERLVLTKQRDGSLLAEIQLAATEEFRSWILSFGRKAVILAPEELRREVVEELTATLSAYETREPDPRAETNHRAGGRSAAV